MATTIEERGRQARPEEKHNQANHETGEMRGPPLPEDPKGGSARGGRDGQTTRQKRPSLDLGPKVIQKPSDRNKERGWMIQKLDNMDKEEQTAQRSDERHPQKNSVFIVVQWNIDGLGG